MALAVNGGGGFRAGGAGMFWRSVRRFLRANFLADSGIIFEEFGGVELGGGSTLPPFGFSRGVVFHRRRLLLAVFFGVGKSAGGVGLFRGSWIQ